MDARGENTLCDDCYMPWLWPENEASVVAWLAIGTQWVYAGMDGVRIGMSYPGVEAGLRLGGHDLGLWPDLQAMESETLRIDSVKRKKAKGPARGS